MAWTSDMSPASVLSELWKRWSSIWIAPGQLMTVLVVTLPDFNPASATMIL